MVIINECPLVCIGILTIVVNSMKVQIVTHKLYMVCHNNMANCGLLILFAELYEMDET